MIRGNVLHDSYNNDILKINNGAEHVVVEGNVFYNQEGSDEHIDINSVSDIVVQDNVFFNDFAGSGRTNANDTSAFIVVKDSNGDSDGIEGSERITLRRNVFLNWEGSTGSGFVLLGEDGQSYYEAHDVLVAKVRTSGAWKRVSAWFSPTALKPATPTGGIRPDTDSAGSAVARFRDEGVFVPESPAVIDEIHTLRRNLVEQNPRTEPVRRVLKQVFVEEQAFDVLNGIVVFQGPRPPVVLDPQHLVPASSQRVDGKRHGRILGQIDHLLSLRDGYKEERQPVVDELHRAHVRPATFNGGQIGEVLSLEEREDAGLEIIADSHDFQSWVRARAAAHQLTTRFGYDSVVVERSSTPEPCYPTIIECEEWRRHWWHPSNSTRESPRNYPLIRVHRRKAGGSLYDWAALSRREE